MKTKRKPKSEFQAEKLKKDSQHRDLRDIAMYLEGILKVQGHLHPFREDHLKNLWDVIATLR